MGHGAGRGSGVERWHVTVEHHQCLDRISMTMPRFMYNALLCILRSFYITHSHPALAHTLHAGLFTHRTPHASNLDPISVGTLFCTPSPPLARAVAMKQIAMKSRLVDGQASSPTLPSPFRPRGRGIALALEAPLHPEPSGKMWLIHKPNAVRPDPLPIIARDCDQPCSPDPRCARAGSSARRHR